MKKTKKSLEEIEKVVSSLSHIDIKRIKEAIGTGYANKLVERLKKKTGKSYTSTYIRKCFVHGQLRATIVFEALLMAQEI